MNSSTQKCRILPSTARAYTVARVKNMKQYRKKYQLPRFGMAVRV